MSQPVAPHPISVQKALAALKEGIDCHWYEEASRKKVSGGKPQANLVVYPYKAAQLQDLEGLVFAL